MATTPLRLSVLIPNYNDAQLLPRALDSVLRQSRPADEILIGDDASTDNSLEVLEGYQRLHPSIRVVRNPQNLGAVGNQLHLLRLVTGDFVCPLAADSYLMPGYFERAMALLEQHPQSGGCASDLQLVDVHSGEGMLHRRLRGPDRYYDPDELARAVADQNYTVTGINTIINRRALLEPGTLLEESKWTIDWLWTSIAAFRYGMCCMEGTYSRFEVDTASLCHAGADGPQHRTVIRAVLDHLSQPQYREVARRIRRAGALEQLGPKVLEEVLGRPRYWSFASWPLLRRVFLPWLKMRVAQLFPGLLVFGKSARRKRQRNQAG